MKEDFRIRTLLQSSVLTSLRALRQRGQDTLWTVSQIRAEMPPRWRPERIQGYVCLKDLAQRGLVESGPSKLIATDIFDRAGGPFKVVGFRLTTLGLQEHDRFLSIMADQIARSNAVPGAGKAAA